MPGGADLQNPGQCGDAVTAMTPVRLLALVAAIWLLGSCASPNRYDDLTALPLEQVRERFTLATQPGPRLGIAFGGGGVRGFMHLGVIKALDEAGIRADLVTGTSAGAIAAAMYASGLDYARIEELALSVSRIELLDLVLSRRGLVHGRALAFWLRESTGCRTFRDLALPLGVTVTDLSAGRALLVVDGDLGGAVQASASVPGTVVPVQAGAATLIDGGVLTVLPVRFARAMGADIVVGVDIYCGNYPTPRGHAIDTMFAAFRLQSCFLSEEEAAESDFVIRPAFEPDSPASFSQREEAIAAGYEAMKTALPALRARLSGKHGQAALTNCGTNAKND